MNQSTELYKYLRDNPIIYVTRDIERALGILPGTKGFYIVTNDTETARRLQSSAQGKIILISRNAIQENFTNKGELKDTHELLESLDTRNFLNTIPSPKIVVFKNTPLIEKICEEYELKLINPSALLAKKIEDKLSQVEWLGDCAKFLPPYEITICRQLTWKGTPFIVQFNHAHSGEGTILIDNEEILKELKTKFPDRDVRKTEYIRGPVFTGNNIIVKDKLLLGSISYQITGQYPFTDLPFTTVGNDWGLPKKMLGKEQRAAYQKIAGKIGDLLIKDGWRGLFGIDVVLDEKAGKIFLLEINARQPASASFESRLESHTDENLSVFEAHLAGLLDLSAKSSVLSEIRNGGQLIQRETKTWQEKRPLLKSEELSKNGFSVFTGNFGRVNGELLRIQSANGFMESHGVLNRDGEKVVSLLPINELETSELSKNAKKIITQYEKLPLGPGVKCPYFNNKRMKFRGASRARGGKATPEEIIAEAEEIIYKKGLNIVTMGSDSLYKMLLDNHIGIDCSGLVFHILEAENLEREGKKLNFNLSFASRKSFLRAAIAHLRPAQNTSVSVFAEEKNSREVSVSDISAGDFITMLYDEESEKQYDHMVIVTEVTRQKNMILRLKYFHSIAWSSDGHTGHGARFGKIEIEDEKLPITRQLWTEKNLSGEDNPTFKRASAAKTSVRRLKWW
ncbi:MAG: hypothetical protein Q8P52_01755 [bacterium]|nr:hypothetical protein [bacterium]